MGLPRLPTPERGMTMFRRRHKRTSWAYCANCRPDLNGDNDSFVEDDVLVRYTCATCSTNSAWDFDSPLPLYVGGWS